MIEQFRKVSFRLRAAMPVSSLLRRIWLQLHGAAIGAGTVVPRIIVSWPHQVKIGAQCLLEPDLCFRYDGYKAAGPSIIIGNRVFLGRGCEFNINDRVEIGDDCLIASGCKFIDHNHGMSLESPMNVQAGVSKPIVLEENVWLGVNTIVLSGVRIGAGAVVGAASVVTKSIPSCEVWAGVPAKRLSVRDAAAARRITEPPE